MSESVKPVTVQPDELATVTITVNGSRQRASVTPRLLLSDFLRDELGLTGTHVGCEHGVCGACTVVLDGQPARSCLTFAIQADGSDVRTVEGLASGEEFNAMQRSFHEHHGLQCGFCTAGFLMTLSAVDPDQYQSDDAIRELLGGNLCRCTGYQNIVTAVKTAWGRTDA